MSALHSTYHEQLPSGRRVWSMREPDRLSEEIVRAERSYLPGYVPAPLTKPVGNQEDPTEDELFDALYRRHKNRILRWARRFFTDPEHVEDATQEAWTAVWRSWGSFPPDPDGQRRLLNEITFNAFLGHAKLAQVRSRRDAFLMDQALDVRMPSGPTNESRLSLRAATIDDLPSLSERYTQDLHDALHILTDREQFVVQRHWDGHSLTSIARQLGAKSGTTAVVVYRSACETLTAHLRDLYQISGPAAKIENHRGLIPVGKHFGFLVVLEYVGIAQKYRQYRCRCERDGCNKEVVVDGPSLYRGDTRSCGCLVTHPGRIKI